MLALHIDSISVLGTQLDFNQYSPNGGRNEPLKMVHNGFEDLQIYFDLETFGNLLQLKAETDFPIPEYHKFLFARPLFLNFFFTFLFLFLPVC